MRYQFVDQISPYGCFPTAVINAYIYKALTPPPREVLIKRSGCEEKKGNIDKPRLLRGLRGMRFRRADARQVLQSAGILVFRTWRFESHAAFVFRSGHRVYAVNACLDSDSLTELIRIRDFVREYGDSLNQYQHWVLC